MKNRILHSFILMYCSVAGFSQPLTFQWSKNLSGTSHIFGNSICTDASGNVYTTGFIEGIADLDPGPAVYPVTSAGSTDIYVQKLNSAGNLVWAVGAGGTSIDEASAVATDAAGNVYVTGNFSGTIDLDPGIGTFTLSASGVSDVFILKLDALGNFLWAVKAGTTAAGCYGNSIAVDGNGNVLVTGIFSGTVDFDPGAGVVNLSSVGGDDIFIMKLTSAGGLSWAKNFGSTASDLSNCIVADQLNDIYITGHYGGLTNFGTPMAPNNFTCLGAVDAFLLKLDPLGTPIWADRFAGNLGETGKTLALDSWGQIYVGGDFNSSALDTDPGPAVYNAITHGGTDFFIIKIKCSNGTFKWARGLGGTSIDEIEGIAVTPQGLVNSIGNFNALVNFDPVYYSPQTSAGSQDIFVSVLDTAGSYYTAVRIGTVSAESGLGIAADTQSNIFITGTYLNTVDFNPSSTATSTMIAGASNIYGGYVVKFYECTPPSAPVVTQPSASATLCSGYSVTLGATASGTATVNWYTSPSGGVLIATGLTALTPTLASASHTFYAEAYTCGGSIFRTPVMFTVWPTPFVYVNGGYICPGTTIALNPSGATSYTYSSGSPVVSPPVATVYSVTGTSAYGCKSSNTATCSVIVYNQPTISISASSNSVCAGAPVTLSVTGANSYTWSTGAKTYSISVAPPSTIIYSVSGVNQNYCSHAATFTVTVYAQPNINISASGNFICAGTPVTLSVTGANSYTWSTGANTASISVTPLSTTVYSAIGVSQNNCSDTSSFTVDVSICEGLEQTTRENFRIYPNPTNGELILALTIAGEINILDALGRNVFAAGYQEGVHSLNLAGYKKGIYFLLLQNKFGSSTHKIVVR